MIPGNGKLSQLANSAHAVGSDSVFPDQSDAKTDVIIGKGVDGVGTCIGLQGENRDTGHAKRSHRGLPLSEKDGCAMQPILFGGKDCIILKFVPLSDVASH